ncbi:MAG TPA: hypothetical protein VHN55_08795 [Sphingomicrobium sp.]|nr:hypothetical protein [Sphingomicrobium sp.]
MLVGHYSASFAARAANRSIKLWVVVGAAQLLDILWSIFVIAGLERVEPAAGVTEGLAFVHYPWSHSLAAAAAWSLVGFVAGKLLKAGTKGSFLVAAVVLSHWFFDALVHHADLPLWPGGGPLVGLALWNYPLAELALELVLFLAAGALLAPLWRSNGLPAWRIPAFLAFGVLFMAATRLAPPPQEVDQAVVGATGLAAYLLFVALAWAVERPLPARAKAE